MKIIGIGPGNPKYLTLDAISEIKEAKKVYGFRRISEDLKEIESDIEVIKTVDDMVKVSLVDNDIAILATGDPLFFGIANTLNNKNVKVDKIIPGLSSSQYLLSKLNLNTNNYNSVSFHGREFNKDLVKKGLNVFFTDSVNTPTFISKKLWEENYRGKFYAGFNLSYDNEKIIEGMVGSCFDNESKLALAVFINEDEMDS